LDEGEQAPFVVGDSDANDSGLRGCSNLCPARRAAATGITGTRGWATPRTRCTRCCASASPRFTADRVPVDGRPVPNEEQLEHLEGYRGSRPVRVGNDAGGQLQLDIQGEVIDAVYLYNKYGAAISYDLWVRLRRLINWVCENWRREDVGIWERRGPTLRLLEAHVLVGP
jgi:glycosyl hydrolase family 15